MGHLASWLLAEERTVRDAWPRRSTQNSRNPQRNRFCSASSAVSALIVVPCGGVGRTSLRTMKVLLAPHGTRGDVQPLLALARGLRERGHEPSFLVPDDCVRWI